MRIRFDESTLKVMRLFEGVTHARLRDCIIPEQPQRILFVVEPGELGKAIGKNAINIRNLERGLNRKIKIVEFNPEVTQFVRNLILPLSVDNVSLEEGKVLLHSQDTQVKSLLIGRNAQNLRANEEIARRYFDVKEIRVV